MRTPEDGDKVNTGLGAPIRKEEKKPEQIWRDLPGRPGYETDGRAIKAKDQPPQPWFPVP